MELIHQVGRRKEIPFDAGRADGVLISRDQFEMMVSRGKKLVIVDDMVVDVEEFIDVHPGGKFSLGHNIGRDVSKYFHGGYSLENIQGVPHHTHSNDARRIVNSLVIGRLIDEAPIRLMKVKGVDRFANFTGSCKTIQFKDVDQGQRRVTEKEGQLIVAEEISSNDGVKQLCPLKDFSSLGRHYLIKSTSHPKTQGGPSPSGEFDPKRHGIKRHYTECFCMRSLVYENLLKIARAFLDSMKEDNQDQ